MMIRHNIQLLLLLLPSLLCYELSPVIDKAMQVVDSNYHHNHPTSIIWAESSHLEVTDFLIKFNKTVKITNLATLNDELIKQFKIHKVIYKQTVFFTAGAEEFGNLMSLLKPHIVVPIRLVLVLTKLSTDVELLRITKIASENDLANILIVSTGDGTNTELTTYYPYSNSSCEDYFPVKIYPPSNNNLFPNKFSNFHRCPIRVSVVPFLPYTRINIVNNTVKSVSGLDGYLFTTMTKKINASINFISWSGGAGTFINGTATGAFANLVYNRADINIPAIVINYLRYPVAQVSHVFQTIDGYWYGPRRHEIQAWRKVLQPLSADLTPAIAVSFILFVIVTKIVIRCNLREIDFRHGVAFQSFIIFLGQGVKINSNSFLVNSLFIIWIWFCMIVRFVYQGELVNGLQKTVLEKPFSNLREAVRALDGYGGGETFREFYRGTKYFKGFQVLNVSEIRPLLMDIARGKKKFLIASNHLLKYELNGRVQWLEEPISHAPVSFFMRPRWPASKEINAVIQRLAETGFVEIALRNYINKYNKKEKKRNKDRNTQPLGMKTLIGCFYGLGFLYIVCFLVFIAEIIHSKVTQN